ncbi:MAG: hypothetical protein KDD38_09745 [Bdellovibrionales bacterium]|nr:hypothetical protein [Bdellovibrionales bacterium]
MSALAGLTPERIRCINPNFNSEFQEISLSKIRANEYSTILLSENAGVITQEEKLSHSRLYQLRNEVFNINSLDVVIEVKILTPVEPTSSAYIKLNKYNVELRRWICKGYF